MKKTTRIFRKGICPGETCEGEEIVDTFSIGKLNFSTASVMLKLDFTGISIRGIETQRINDIFKYNLLNNKIF